VEEVLAAMTRSFFDFSDLSVAERIQLAVDLWDSIPPELLDPVLSGEETVLLDQRLDDLEREPEDSESWDTVRDHLYERLKNGE
jgi:putative addiction module component (TIGR02574 family)